MANVYQRAASRRKLIYFGIIVGLFVVTIFARGVVAVPLSGVNEKIGKYTIRAQARELELTEYESEGQEGERRDPELTGSAVRLLLTGSRGFAVCVLWVTAYEKQMRQEWNELELTVKSITTLQPHFVLPWHFQSWNLAYNVSVEMDRLNDMYFYIARGISLLSEGESINRNNPDMRYMIAFYYQNKFTVSDKKTTLRCLYQLSCMPAEDRNPDNLMTAGKLDPAKFQTFCEKYPQLVRRMRESVIRIGKKQVGGRQEDITMHLAVTPDQVVAFLRDNQKLPTRYSKEDPRRLETRLKQFPVVPPAFPNGDQELKPNEDWRDDRASAILVARGWFKYANEVIPPPNPVPGPTDYSYRDPERRRRLPRSPMLIIFRQGPPRAQTFVAEHLAENGWFDSEPWVVDEGLSGGDRWFPDRVEIKPTANSREAWALAHTMWLNHGRENGLYLDADQFARYQDEAKRYSERRHFPIPSSIGQTEVPPLRPDEQEDEGLRKSFAANMALSFFYRNNQVTNYETFLNQALAEMDPMTVRARKLVYQAERYQRNVDRKSAIAAYEQVFGTQNEFDNMRSGAGKADDNRLIWPRVLLRHRKFAESEKTQEDLYNTQMNYLRIVQDSDLPKYKQITMSLFTLLQAAGPGSEDAPYRVAATHWLLSEKYLPQLSQGIEPFWPPGPLDGINPETNVLWIGDLVKHRALLNAGMIKPAVAPPTTPATAPAGSDASKRQ